MKAFILVGPTGSGKSKWANDQAVMSSRYVHIDYAVVRRMVYLFQNGGEVAFSPSKWKNKWNTILYSNIRDHIRRAADAGKHVILNSSSDHLDVAYRESLIDFLKGDMGYDVVVSYFVRPYEELISNDLARNESVGESVIMQEWVALHNDSGYSGNTIHVKKQLRNEAFPSCVIFDVDGTLASMNGRSPYASKGVINDQCNEYVANIARYYRYETDTRVIIFTGRAHEALEETKAWLSLWDIPYDAIYIRKPDDRRPDYLIKEEFLRNHVLDLYRVVCIVDDRPQVVKRWVGKFGLPTLTVGNPWISF